MSRAAEYAGGDAGFQAWLEKVDAAVQRRIVLSIFDLPDRLLRDAYDAGTRPEDVADEAVSDAYEEVCMDEEIDL